MKKFLGLLAILLLFNNCDDGNLAVDNIDFGDATIISCSDTNNKDHENDVLYKLNGNEVLILVMEDSKNAYQNVVAGPQSFQINSEHQVRYRLYNGTVGADNICATIQPGTPQVTEEWIAISGTIVINTIAVYSTPDETTGATEITKYNHEISFANIVYAKPDGSTLIFAESLFGDFATTANIPPFNFNTVDDDVNMCSSSNLVYNVAEASGQESLVISNISTTLINGDLKTKTEAIGETTNKVVYKYYTETSLPITPADYFCVSPTPILPLVLQTWTAELGNPTTQKGYLEVTTEDDGAGNYKHTIYFIGVTFYDAASNSSFYYGNKILYGVLRIPK